MAAQYDDDTMADLFSCFHIENSAGLLKCNGTEHLVKKKILSPVWSYCLWMIFIAFVFLLCASKSIEMQVLMKPPP